MAENNNLCAHVHRPEVGEGSACSHGRLPPLSVAYSRPQPPAVFSTLLPPPPANSDFWVSVVLSIGSMEVWLRCSSYSGAIKNGRNGVSVQKHHRD